MSHRFIEEEAVSDVAFEALGKDLPEVFKSAGDAVMNVMIENLDAIKPVESRVIEADNDELDLLLLDFLQNLVFYKDADRLLLRAGQIEVSQRDGTWHLRALGEGEHLDPDRHIQRADVKAVTLHNFRLEQVASGWRAHVILDI